MNWIASSASFQTQPTNLMLATAAREFIDGLLYFRLRSSSPKRFRVDPQTTLPKAAAHFPCIVSALTRCEMTLGCVRLAI